jgi:hypothetical protein
MWKLSQIQIVCARNLVSQYGRNALICLCIILIIFFFFLIINKDIKISPNIKELQNYSDWEIVAKSSAYVHFEFLKNQSEIRKIILQDLPKSDINQLLDLEEFLKYLETQPEKITKIKKKLPPDILELALAGLKNKIN